MRSFLVAAALSAAAPVAVAAPSVIVLETPASSQHAWPSGERAVIAELLASDVELVLRPSNAPSLAELELEVLKAATEADAAGAVGVGREGFEGFAIVAPHSGRPPVRVQDDVRQGAVAEGAVALRVSEVLRARRFDLPPEALRRNEAVPAAPAKEPQALPLWPWISVGGVGSRGASSISAVTGVGVRVPLHPWISLEPSGGFTIGGLDVHTAAGDVTLSLRRATLEIVVAPVTHRGISAGVGAGGGVAWFSAVPRANAGYEGTEQSTQVSLLALRGFGAWQTRHLKALLFLELATMLPAVTVRASGTELASLGQPWLTSGVAFGYTP
jgi:hypothetical protein